MDIYVMKLYSVYCSLCGIMCRQCLLTQTDKDVGYYVPLTVRETYIKGFWFCHHHYCVIPCERDNFLIICNFNFKFEPYIDHIKVAEEFKTLLP